MSFKLNCSSCMSIPSASAVNLPERSDARDRNTGVIQSVGIRALFVSLAVGVGVAGVQWDLQRELQRVLGILACLLASLTFADLLAFWRDSIYFNGLRLWPNSSAWVGTCFGCAYDTAENSVRLILRSRSV